jgi:hypothetical protein
MTAARLTAPVDVLKFMFGGNATFTLVSTGTGARYTYRVRNAPDYTSDTPFKEGKVMMFVQLLTGADNEASYTYLGMFKMGKGYEYGVKSPVGANAPAAKAFAWFWRLMMNKEVLEAGALPETVEFWHEGRCAKCGRKLTVPSSIESGFGPECMKQKKFTAEAA